MLGLGAGGVGRIGVVGGWVGGGFGRMEHSDSESDFGLHKVDNGLDGVFDQFEAYCKELIMG